MTFETDSSRFLRRFSRQIVETGPGLVLDVPSGAGRNALLLQSLGCNVLCIDHQEVLLASVAEAARECRRGTIRTQLMDLERDQWTFEDSSFSAVMNVHYVSLQLIPKFISCLRPGGCLLIETYENRGGNYQALPKKNQIKEIVKHSCSFICYEEKPAGPSHVDAVTVRLFAQKHS